MLRRLLFPEFFPEDFSVTNFGPEVEQGQVPGKEGDDPQLRTEKENMILRMMSSDIFLKGYMSLEDIAKVTQVKLKWVKNIYQDLLH